tara:strand:+ start:782 stop:1768 length:987 start_codon:yes stop_codon:yes gene_type:complete
MKALVTGGGGFLGSHLAKALLKRDDEIRIVGRRDYPDLPTGIERMKADLYDLSDAIIACEGRDVVFHAAAKASIWGTDEEFYSSNVVATRNIIDACIRQKVRKLIFTSSPSVVFCGTSLENADENLPYPKTYLSKYAKTKAIAERMVIKANGRNGLLTVGLRPHLIWGPGDPHLVPRILQRARKGKLAQVGEGKNKVDIIFIDNAVEAHLKACDYLENGSPLGGQCYFISDGEPVVLWDWINILLNKMNIPPIRKKITRSTAYTVGVLLEAIYRIFRLPGEPQMTRFLATQLADSHYFDISRAKKDFGFVPLISSRQGMERLIASLKS